MYFSKRITTINKMTKGNPNIYLFKTQRFNLTGNPVHTG